jgi:hypothetical protein
MLRPNSAIPYLGAWSDRQEWAQSDLNRRPPGYQPDRQRKCRSEAVYPIWDPEDPPLDALERSFDWLATTTYAEFARSSTEDDLDQTAQPLPAPGQPGALLSPTGRLREESREQ